MSSNVCTQVHTTYAGSARGTKRWGGSGAGVTTHETSCKEAKTRPINDHPCPSPIQRRQGGYAGAGAREAAEIPDPATSPMSGPVIPGRARWVGPVF